MATDSDGVTSPRSGIVTVTVPYVNAAAPTFSPVAGTYTSGQTVTLISSTPNATIYYTTNGTAPTTSSASVTSGGTIAVAASETVKALATAPGYSASSVSSASYVIQVPAATPTFSPVAGTYTSAQTVAISSSTSGATIYYTTDGTTPTTGSTSLTSGGTITVATSETVKAIAVAAGYNNSAVGSANYVIQVPAATPTFSPLAGTYTSAQTVAISSSTSGATIYYTTDGTTPTTSSNSLTSGGTIAVATSETVKAIAVAAGYNNSAVGSANYVIQVPAATPTFSPLAGTYTSAQTVAISSSTSGATIYYTLDGSTPTTSSPSVTSGGTITVAASETVKALATASGYNNSAVTNAVYIIQPPAATPTFSLGTGIYTASQLVTLNCATSGAAIYYTTDGSTPTTSSASVTSGGTVPVGTTETLKAMALASGGSNSSVASASYTIDSTTSFTRTGLVAWMRADTGIIQSGGQVSQWADQSGNGNNAAQTASSQQPALVSSISALNGKPVVRFNSANITNLAIANTASLNPAQLTIIAVAETNTSSSVYPTLLIKQDSTSPYPYYLWMNTSGPTMVLNAYENSNNQAVVGAEVSGTLAGGSYGVIEGVYDQTAAKLFVNGTLAQSTNYTSPLYSTNTDPLEIGGQSGLISRYALDGDIAEVMVFSQPLTDQQRHDVEAYLYTRYGIGTQPQASVPTLSEGTGTYSSAQTVTLTPGMGGQTVYYTLDGSDPTTSSTRIAVTSATTLTISTTTTLKTVETDFQYANSAVTTTTYTLQAATPTFSPGGGTYTTPQTVTLSSTTSGATIYYTIDGTTPTTSSTLYTSPISVAASETVKALATATGYSNSTVGSATYILPTATPTFAPAAGTFTTQQLVTVTSTTSGATIYYTLDGTTPTISSPSVTSGGTVLISKIETLKALAVASGSTTSAIATGAYSVTGQVSGGYYHTIALKSDGSVWTWGNSGFGQLGDGNGGEEDSAVNVPSLSGIIQVGAGYYHNVALKSDGTVWTWGLNSSGQLGDGTLTQRDSPVQVQKSNGSGGKTNLTNIVAICAGAYHTLALDSSGNVWAWGLNSSGQLGDGTTSQQNLAEQLTTLTGVSVKNIAAGAYHSLLLTTTGTVEAWGLNSSGQVGDGTTTQRDSPVAVSGLSGITSLAGGDAHSLALKNDGTVWAWGSNYCGQLGDGTTAQQVSPVQVSGLSGATALAAGLDFSLALKSDGTAWAWGLDNFGQLGNGTTLTTYDTPIQMVGITGGIAVGSGAFESCVIRNDGTLWSCGGDTVGLIGDGTTSSCFNALPLLGLNQITVAAAGNAHGLIVKSDGTVWAFGDNINGELGDGTTNERSTPVQVTGLTGVVEAAAGSFHSLVSKSDGTVWAWGNNSNGQLGDGTTTQRNNPVLVSGLSGITAFAIGINDSYALKNDGTVWAWGANANGQLGNGTTTQSITPVQISGLSGVVTSIKAGNNYAVALKSDGTVWAWGLNSNGQLGNGTTTQENSPEQVPGLSGVIAISAGGGQTLALKSDGTVWAWGLNNYGQLGDGTTTQRNSPVEVSGLSSVIGICAANYYFSEALKSDGTVWCWGVDGEGELGNGSTTPSLTPVEVPNVSGIATISTGSQHSFALKQDGTVETWGFAGYGQIGVTTNRSVPFLIPGFNFNALVPTPTVNITAPTNNVTLAIGSPQTFTASASETGGTIASVSYYFNSILIGQSTSSPYSVTWVPTTWGNFTFTAIATDTAGNTSYHSTPVTVQVPYGNQASTPTYSLASGAYSPPQTVTVASTTPDAIIYFTTDGSNPTIHSPSVSSGGTITVSSSETVKSMAVASGYAYSAIASASYTIEAPPVVNSAGTATGTEGSSFSYSITATNNPTSYSAMNLPAGLSINATTGVISGTASVTGTFSVTISATNAYGTGTGTLALTVNPPVPVISGASAVTATSGTSFSYTITASNSPSSYGAAGLPSGLNFNSTTGVISGTPTTGGIFSVELSATNITGTGNAYLTLTVYVPVQVPVINSATSASGTVGSTFNYTITATNAATSYSATGLPAGLNLNPTTGQISGTPTAAGTSTVTLSATNTGGTGSATLTLNISNPPVPVITSGATVSGDEGIAFNYAISANNTPTSFSVISGTLPTGLSLNSGTGVISGTPTSTGTSTVTLGASNSGGTGSATLTLTINGPAAPVITSSATAVGFTGTAFSYAIKATNSPTSFNLVSGTLPSGLSLNNGTGVISGTPTDSGFSTVSVTIGASNGTDTGSATLTFTLNPPAPVITSASTVNAYFGQSFNYAITASNSPTSYGVIGTLPAGLSLDTSTGVISGTPTTTGSTPTTSEVTLTATNIGGTGTATFIVTINVPLPVPVINSGTVATGDTGVGFNYAITTATIGPATTTSYGATGLPAGLTLDSSTGIISGTPTVIGTSTVTLSATNSAGTGEANLTLTVNPSTAPVVSSSTTPSGNANSPFNYTIIASNSPTSFDATGLPAGLALDPSTGIISGTPASAGTSMVTISATNTAGTGKIMVTLTINPPAPVLSGATTASGTFGVAFTPYTITASNNPTSYSATGLPPGLNFNTNTGVMSGTPTTTGMFTVTLGATNAGGTSLANLTVTITSGSGLPILTRSVASGYTNTLVLKSDGTVWAAGHGYFGEMGTGGNAASDIYTKVSGLPSGIVAVCEGYESSYALASDGTVWAWGYGYDGELGDGTYGASSVPVQVVTSSGTPLTGILALSAGYGGVMALKSDGTVWTWGINDTGELGNGDNTYSSSNRAVEVITSPGHSLTGIVGIACGAFHNLAVDSSGNVWGWGNDADDELGDGSGLNSNLAIQVPGMSGITSVAAGRTYSLAVGSDGTVWAWGDESEGYLGNGITIGNTMTTGPVQVLNSTGGTLNNVAAVSSQGDHTLVLKNDGTVWAWGQNDYGQLGNGTVTDNSPYPVQVSNLNNVSAISAGYSENTVLKNDGSIWCWGYNDELSDYGAGDDVAPTALPSAVPNLTGITSITGFKGHYLALDTNGNVWTWGDPTPGEIGNGTTITGSNSPVQVQGLSGITAIASGAYFNLALKNDGTVWAWGGTNSYGELGNGTTGSSVGVAAGNEAGEIPATLANYQTPTQVVTNTGSPLGGSPNVRIKAISCQAYTGVALDTNGTVWTWGFDVHGNLGNGDTSHTNTNAAAPISGMGVITAIVSASYRTLAIDSDGNVWNWGENNFGELGNGTFKTDSNVPVQISGLSGITDVSAGFYFSMALKSDGTVWTWGLNTDGELGNGALTNSFTPAQVPSLSGITAIQAGGEAFHALALKSDGTLWTWGSNSDGQLGIGTFGPVSGANSSPTGISIPVQVVGLGGATVTGLASEKYGTAVLTSSGTVLQWGDKSYEPFGFSVPVQVAGPLTNPAPVITPVAGSFSSSQSVTISTSLTSGTIYYTLDGTEPTTSSLQYTGSFTLSGDALVSAAVFVNGAIATPVATTQLYINDSSQTGLAAAPTGLSVTPANGQLDLSWTLGSLLDYSALNVYRSSDGGATYQLVATLNPSATSYTDTNVQSGTNYQYKVGTFNVSGVSDTAASSAVAPTAPSTFTITITTPSGATNLP